MDKDSELSSWLQNTSFGQGERVLILLSRYEDGLTIAEIRKLFEVHGRSASAWNFSKIADRLANDQKAILVRGKWTITEKGLDVVIELGAVRRTATMKAVSGLREFAGRLTDDTLRNFVEEAIGCLEHRLFRSAVVLSWSGAVWILQQHILKSYLDDFNRAGGARFPDFEKIKNAESFGRLQERDFLQLLEDLHLIGKSLKGILIQRLDLRNTCGHPNSVKINESTAASHVELLIENVFLRF